LEYFLHKQQRGECPHKQKNAGHQQAVGQQHLEERLQTHMVAPVMMVDSLAPFLLVLLAINSSQVSYPSDKFLPIESEGWKGSM
jgi:hypothetical protein